MGQAFPCQVTRLQIMASVVRPQLLDDKHLPGVKGLVTAKGEKWATLQRNSSKLSLNVVLRNE